MASAYQAKSLYDFESKDPRLLNFKQDETFVVIEQLCKDPNWHYAVSETGLAGFIPVTYIGKTECTPDEFLELVEKTLDALQSNTASVAEGATSQHSLQGKALRRLHHLKEALITKSEIPPLVTDLPKETAFGGEVSPSEFFQEEYSKINAEWLCENLGKNGDVVRASNWSSSPDTMKNNVQEKNSVNLQTLAAELIEQVRNQTQLSHNLSRVAVMTVVKCLSKALPSVGIWDSLLDSVMNSEIFEKPIIPTQDGERLQMIFRKLWYCKNDEQQRSWPTHEDENVIMGLLEELYTILVDADPRVCRNVMHTNDYEFVSTLALYYQMEPRPSLRVWMLRIFLTMCELDINVVGLLLHSVLPMELARDLQSNSDDVERMKYTSLLLTVIFSTGKKPPNEVHDHVGEKFIGFLLDCIENPDVDEEVADLAVGTLLAINLHLAADNDNFVLKVLKERKDARSLTERLMLLINREDDPAKVLNHEIESPNSVLKLLTELFSDAVTAELFYTNDVAVLIDIITRQLSDLPHGDKRRLMYLDLIYNILRHIPYEGHRHEELQKCFQTVLAEEESSQDAIAIVQAIHSNCSQWFTPAT